ncbi:DUF2735 domain-containing protein [Fulvimarina sp. MAC8]|uniref:DUF2735 domain-containing protein n=1 Tax=Fulvimarina sp. MAC8 TaxID=3162874 RepID=UPI0032EB9D71
MTMGIETQSARIYQFPVGGRAGYKKHSHAWSDDRATKPFETANHVDWRAAYHDEAIAEDTGRN